MSDDSQPVSAPKRGHWTDKIKEENERLKAQLDALTAGAPAAVTVAPTAPDRTGYDPSLDPFAWIDERVPEVHLVSTQTMLIGHVNPTPAGAKREDKGERVKADGAPRLWSNCPFKWQGRTDEDTRNLRVANAQHYHFTVHRWYADLFWQGKYAPFPTTAFVAPSDFTGKDREGRIQGRRRPCSTDTLRELIRWYSQTYAGGLWIDAAYHPGKVEWQHPNPYGRSFDGLIARRMAPDNPVILATDAGDITVGGGR